METKHAFYKRKVVVYTEKKQDGKNSQRCKQRSAVADKHKKPIVSAAP
jgi:hypothetical protein